MPGGRREVGRKSSDLLGAQLGSRWDKLIDIELNEMQRLTKSARERNPTFWPEFFSTEDEVQEDGPSQPSRPEVSETSWTPASLQSSTVYDEHSEPTPSAYRCLDPHRETETRTQPHFHWPGRLQQNGAAKQPVPSAFQQRCADASQDLGFSGAVTTAGESATVAARGRGTIEHGEYTYVITYLSAAVHIRFDLLCDCFPSFLPLSFNTDFHGMHTHSSYLLVESLNLQALLPAA